MLSELISVLSKKVFTGLLVHGGTATQREQFTDDLCAATYNDTKRAFVLRIDGSTASDRGVAVIERIQRFSEGPRAFITHKDGSKTEPPRTVVIRAGSAILFNALREVISQHSGRTRGSEFTRPSLRFILISSSPAAVNHAISSRLLPVEVSPAIDKPPSALPFVTEELLAVNELTEAEAAKIAGKIGVSS